MPAFHVEASTDIKAPIQRVYDTLVDFTTWPDWSPWLYIEPDAEVVYTGNKGEPKHGYQWKGNKVGAGSMSLTHVAPQRIDCNLQILKPFKSTATVWFDLVESTPGNTTLTWNMDSKLPFFMFWMLDSMTGMITADYKRGLALLKAQLETGKIQSRTQLVETEDVSAKAFVGKQVVTSFDQLSSSMNQTFSQLSDLEKSGKFTSIGRQFCIYDRIDFKRDEVTYTAAFPVSEPITVELPLVSRIRPACRALKAVHTGAYQHLPNAWAMIMSEARTKKLKVSKTNPPFEHYLNDPDSIVHSDLMTELYLPLK